MSTGCWGHKSIWYWQIDPNSCTPAQRPTSRVPGGCSNPSSGAANCIREISWPHTSNCARPSRYGLLGELLSVKTLSFKCTSCPSCNQYCSGGSGFGFLIQVNIEHIWWDLVSTILSFTNIYERFSEPSLQLQFPCFDLLYCPLFCKCCETLRCLELRLKIVVEQEFLWEIPLYGLLLATISWILDVC